MSRRRSRSGLILLVVLGMLALLSLLSVTYLVFSGESRKASLQLARGDYRGTPPEKIIDQAIRQVIRGTTDKRSPLWLNDILGDLYGESTDEPFQFQQARSTVQATPDAKYYGSMSSAIARDNPLRMGSYVMPNGLTTFDSNSPEAPRLYGGHLLKIPIAWPFQSGDPREVRLPEQHDAWTGRVVTFTTGPLEGQSFRVLKYTGEVDIVPVGGTPTLNPAEAANQYSIVIDLNEVRDRVTSKKYGTKMVTRSISDWITSTASTNCLELLYQTVVANGSVYTFDAGYTFFVNAGVTNSNGLGINMAKAVDYTPLSSNPNPSTYANVVPDAFLANHGQTYAYQSAQGITYTPTGDTDEPNDAVDFQNFYLAMRQGLPAVPPTNSDASDLITPSFHRTAVINYLAAMAPNLSAFSGTQADAKQLTDFIELVRRATGRPLSVRIRNFFGPNADFTINPAFTGSTLPDNRTGFGGRAPQLLLDWANINQPQNTSNLQSWLRWNTRGPYDVDNDGDLVGDSIWLDLNFPLVTSPEGKLLKVLAAFYIEDMDGKLDLNASGSREQANDATFSAGMPDTRFGYGATGTPVGQWPQGTGYGPADISLRHIFDDYDAFLTSRWGASGNEIGPGVSGDDPISTLNDRAFDDTSSGTRSYRYNNPTLLTQPPFLIGHANTSFPFSVRGRAGIAVDLLGNPIYIENATQFNETNDDPYDSFVIKDRRSDRGVSVSDWERLIRFNDVDRSSMPRSLQNVASSLVPGQAGYLEKIRSISPRNVTLNLPRFAGEYDYPRAVPNFPNPPSIVNLRRRVSSFAEFVEGYAQARFAPPAFPTPPFPVAPKPFFNRNAMRQLFPIEFRQNLPLNINRPLGNGTDDTTISIDINGNNISVPPNGTIDEADEIRAGQLARYPANQNSLYSEVYVNLPSGYDLELEAEMVTPAFKPLQFDGNQPKQLLARHLYCLAQLILPDNYVFPNNPTTTAPTVPLSAQDKKTRARILAQWAVNVVDFRDPDSAMTRFPYDEDPFMDPTNGIAWVPTDGVVFGMESPELLLTEAIAFHDQRAIKDPNDASKRIQYRIPQGSLFLEFYCPRTTSTMSRGTGDGDIPPSMRDLYEFDATGTLKLNLGKMTPTDGYNPVSFPVWRVLLTAPVKNGTSFKDKFTEVYEKKDDRFKYSYQMDNHDAKLNWQLDSTNSAPGPADITEPTIDRILWFSNAQPTNAAGQDNTAWSDSNAPDKIFRGLFGSRSVAGGQYLVVGPREVTYLGSKDQGNGTGARFNRPSNQRIEIVNGANLNWVQIWDLDNNPLFWVPAAPTPLVANNTATTASNWGFASKVRSAATLIAGMDKPASWTDTSHNNYTIGLNVSEPTRNNYYPEPDEFANSKDTTRDASTNAPGFAATGQSKDAYIDTDSNTMTTRRIPMDMSTANNYGYLKTQQWEQHSSINELPKTKTEQNWNAAVIQRLADPNRGYHAKYNPYITVDWLSIPLTVFSGEETFEPTPSGVFLATRQKTGAILPVTEDTNTTANAVTFFSYHTEFPKDESVPSAPTTPLDTFFSFPLPLEFVAKTPAQVAMTRPAPNDQQFATLGYLNDKFWLRGTAGTPDDYEYTVEDRYKGSPGPNAITKVPVAPYFPNRDFVNPLELTSVSLSAPGQFMQEFTVPAALDPAKPVFTHVLDFEDLQVPKPTNTNLNVKRGTGMLFDLLTTKNPWPDAFKVEAPASVSVTTVSTPDDLAKTNLFEPYKPPFNFLPTYREPGKVNLNTLTEENVFRGLMWNAITPRSYSDRMSATILPYWLGFQNLRRGFDVGNNSAIPPGNPYLHASLPVEFAHPFNAANAFESAASPMPTYDRASHAGLMRRGDTTTPSTNFPNTYQMATLGGPTPDAKPRLFTANVNNVFPNGGMAMSNVPMNTFIQNYPASRLTNLTTDRSSVYSIRVTLGYFEADAAGNIGVEYGADQGRAKRYRAIYLVDRSIPVGYQPGQDLNTENIILMRRIIE